MIPTVSSTDSTTDTGIISRHPGRPPSGAVVVDSETGPGQGGQEPVGVPSAGVGSGGLEQLGLAALGDDPAVADESEVVGDDLSRAALRSRAAP